MSNDLARHSRSGESDLVDTLVVDQRIAGGRAIAGDDVENAFGQTRFKEQLTQTKRGERGVLGRLDKAAR